MFNLVLLPLLEGFIAAISIFISFVVPFYCIYKGYKLANKVARIENLNRIDFATEKEYYRDVLKDYSAVELYYLEGLKDINEKSSVIATLLNLKLKGIIDIKENKIEIINPHIDSLKHSEKYVMNHIQDGKIILDTDGYTLFYAKKEALEDQLIEEDPKRNKKIKRMNILFVILGLLLIIIVILAMLQTNSIIGSLLATLLLTILFFLLIPVGCIFLFSYKDNKKNFYVRTSKGVELARKLKGLKNFLNDFGNMEEKNQKEIVLWEDYLIYSIIFEINDNVYKELESMVEILFEHGKVYIEKK